MSDERSEEGIESTGLFGDLLLMVDVFAACIETGVMPAHGSPCHRKARQLVEQSGQKPKRKRRRLPPNSPLGQTDE